MIESFILSRPRPAFGLIAGAALLAVTVGAQVTSSANPSPERPAEDRHRQETVTPAPPPSPSFTQTSAGLQPPPPYTAGAGADSTRFNVLDTDSDGRISQAEFTLAPNKPIEDATRGGEAERASTKNPDLPSRADQQNATGVTDSNIGTRTDVAERFQELDTDKDGFLSRAELAAEEDGR